MIGRDISARRKVDDMIKRSANKKVPLEGSTDGSRRGNWRTNPQAELFKRVREGLGTEAPLKEFQLYANGGGSQRIKGAYLLLGKGGGGKTAINALDSTNYSQTKNLRRLRPRRGGVEMLAN